MTDSSATKPVILLVEDDEQVREMISSLLNDGSVHMLEAETGAEGLRVAQTSGLEIDLLLTDMLLPELSGYDLAAELRLRYPRMKIIMMTGYIEGEIVQRGISELEAAFLDKPFKTVELRRLVGEALAVRTAAG